MKSRKEKHMNTETKGSITTWEALFEQEKKQGYFQETLDYIEKERENAKTIYPAKEDVFNAFCFTKLDDVKVVILGQDPYHGPSQAHGLCFSVLPGIKPPPSLVNIYKELALDIEGFVIPKHGFLTPWAKQGVLLLNTVLTVEEGLAHSHAHLGWEKFTDKVIETLNIQNEGIVFLLWGAHARKKGKGIDSERHCVLEAPHPSPLSAHRGFFGCGHFSKVNAWLEMKGHKIIDWNL